MNNKATEIEISSTRLELKGGRFLSLESPLVMGIVNITPDSFYDGGKYISEEAAIEHAGQLIADGADIIDLGATSTRPGAGYVTPSEELKRLLPVLEYLIKKHRDIPISIDTFHSSVAKETIEWGASLINDISGGSFDSEMYATIGKLKVPYILMHIQGTPETMQIDPHYEDVVEEVYAYFAERIKKLKSAGVRQIIIDPGFGFGKTVEHNYTLLRHIDRFKSLGLPIMAGLSRKSMINKVLKTKPENSLTGTIALNTLAILQGANILRVHDVKEARQVIQLVKQYMPPKTLSE
jgi:dihydropteroate synthase